MKIYKSENAGSFINPLVSYSSTENCDVYYTIGLCSFIQFEIDSIIVAEIAQHQKKKPYKPASDISVKLYNNVNEFLHYLVIIYNSHNFFIFQYTNGTHSYC